MNYKLIQSAIVSLALCGLLSGCLEEDGPAGPSKNPEVESISPAEGEANALVTLQGSGLGNIVSVVFETDAVSAMINPTLNTGNVFMFRVPLDAVPGDQNIVLENGAGVSFSVPFFVIGYPTITAVSNYNFSEGDSITLTGKNLSDVSRVTFTDTDTELTIKHTSATEVTVSFPSTTLKQSTLTVENASGARITSEVFVNREQAFVLFADDYANGFSNGSWGPSGVSTDVAIGGTSSVYMDFPAGWWAFDNFANWGTAQTNDNFAYFTFWIKGGDFDQDVYIQTSQSESGWDTYSSYNKITVEAGEWQYFKLPVADLKLWANGDSWQQIGWRVQGPDAADLRLYVDDVMFIYKN